MTSIIQAKGHPYLQENKYHVGSGTISILSSLIPDLADFYKHG
ncbi:MAG: hypothetical protein U5K51_14605 [Flavobacteriaceae bacterium]|nr:hypothetical protein [Flavobacteriaceae bacterium]